MLRLRTSILRFAVKTLVHQLAKTVAGCVGVAFAVTLALVQIGMYHGAMNGAAVVIDHSKADLWIVPRGVQNFDFAEVINEHHRYLVESVPGVERVETLTVGFGLWQLPNGGLESVEILGFDLDGDMLLPWNVKVGDVQDLKRHRNVFIDAGDLKKLRVDGVGSSTEIFLVRDYGMTANVVGLTERVKSFIASPMILTSRKNATAYCQQKEGSFNYLLAKLDPAADPQEVKRKIAELDGRIEAYTKAEFSKKTQTYWDQATGLGMALFAAAFMGVLIGVGTVGMILYMSTIDHLPQFATLKALGVPNRRVILLVALQALIVGSIGFCVGTAMALVAANGMQQQSLSVELSSGLVWSVLAGTMFFCAAASLLSAVKIVRIDPGMVFHA